MTRSNKPLDPNDPYNRHGTRHQRPEKSSGSKAVGIALGTVAIAAIAAAGLYLIDVDQTKEARLPDVDVKITEGQMPEFDVEVADVNMKSKAIDVDMPTMDVETKTIEIEVPVDVDAGTRSEILEVPTIEIDRPEEDNPANNDTR